jgi:hypothetical protein
MEEGFNCISTSIAIKIHHGFIKYQTFTIDVTLPYIVSICPHGYYIEMSYFKECPQLILGCGTIGA